MKKRQNERPRGGQLPISAFFAPTDRNAVSRRQAESVGDRRPKRPRTESPTAAGPREDPFSSASIQQRRLQTSVEGGSNHGIPDRKPHRRALAQRKLVETTEHRWEGGVDGGERSDSRKPRSRGQYTPLEKQVVKLKEENPGVVLLIEVGYKMRFFGEDAEIAAKCCNIYCYPDHNFMTASFPVPRLPIHVRRLVENGHKVGVVRQTESAAAKAVSQNKNSVFERKLVAMHTRATLDGGEVFENGMDYGQGDSSSDVPSNHLLCLARQGEQIGMVAVESSTGDVRYGTCGVDITDHDFLSMFLRISPRELLVSTDVGKRFEKLLKRCMATVPGARIEGVSMADYKENRVVEQLANFYGDAGTGALETVLSFPRVVLVALCAAKDYLQQFGVDSVIKMGSTFQPLESFEEMQLSANALQQLEVLQNNHNGGPKGSLLQLMNGTRTAFGNRLLRYWLSHPLTDLGLIRERIDAVEELSKTSNGVLGSVPMVLPRLPDLERGLTRILHKSASPKEFVDVLQGLRLVCENLSPTSSKHEETIKSLLLNSLLESASSPDIFHLAREMLASIDVAKAKDNDSVEMFVREDRFPEVIGAKLRVRNAEKQLERILPQLAKQVRMCKLSYVSIQNQGHHLVELPKGHKQVPTTWSKICGTKKVDRYHPPEVKQGIQELELAQDELNIAARKTWSDFLSEFSQHYATCRSAVQALAALDILQGFSLMAQSPGYSKPNLVGPDAPPQLIVKAGKHPVLDGLLDGGAVANDVELRWDGQRGVIVTGPNMGGKSCYIKLAALMVIMAQVGSFVPAESLSMHAFDAIFTRMGASDNIQMGRSTFLEELSDAGSILNNATEKSLVVVDELGRGTATHDGVAIAQATLGYLLNEIQCLTLFVTHYPEVSKMEVQFPERLASYHMDYIRNETADGGEPARKGVGEKESVGGSDGRILFLYRLVKGAADKSFGLNVARMANLPNSVVDMAGEKAEEFQCSQDGDGRLSFIRNLMRDFRGGKWSCEGEAPSNEWVTSVVNEARKYAKIQPVVDCEMRDP
ncbi:hypothetical protein BSKO_06100 [Bryopsis sp. KO-2023]|nr:hypothetical protein BSKO_06100 [Bryopsis sp. KO-2023]